MEDKPKPYNETPASMRRSEIRAFRATCTKEYYENDGEEI